MKVAAILSIAAAIVNVAPSVVAAPVQSSSDSDLVFRRELAELLERHPQVLSQLVENAEARGYDAEELVAREPWLSLITGGLSLVKGLFGGRKKRELGEDYLEARHIFSEEYDSRAFEDVYVGYSARVAPGWDDMD